MKARLLSVLMVWCCCHVVSAQNNPVPDVDLRGHVLSSCIINTGTHATVDLGMRWAGKIRYFRDANLSDTTIFDTRVYSFRGYYTLLPLPRCDFYAGAEGVYVLAREYVAGRFSAVGFATGLFGGVQYHFTPCLSVGADIGAYLSSAFRRLHDTSPTNIDMIINSFIELRL